MIKTLIGREYEIGKILAEGTSAERLAMDTKYLSTGSIFVEIDNGGNNISILPKLINGTNKMRIQVRM